tara:strand:- start:8444 stop:8977 length:534 start_codon:yes stop_codon:yes gene_type:complete
MANYKLIYTLLNTTKWGGGALLDAKVGACAVHTLPDRLAYANDRSYGHFPIRTSSRCLPTDFHAKRQPFTGMKRWDPLAATDVECQPPEKFRPWFPSRMSYHYILLKPISEDTLFDVELTVHRRLEEMGCSVSDRASSDGNAFGRCRELFRVNYLDLKQIFEKVSSEYSEICFAAEV